MLCGRIYEVVVNAIQKGKAMTREEIERDYKVVGGIIRSPGKFEGEPIWAPYFWEALLNGEADTDEGGVATFTVTKEDVAQFADIYGGTEIGDLSVGEVVVLECCDNGFVYCWVR